MAADSVHCTGNHSVAGAGGCHNAQCKGRQLCVAGCATCPDFRGAWPTTVNRHCRGNHPVKGGCEYQGCKGRKLCLPDCTTCPDFVQSFGVKPTEDSRWCRGGSRCSQPSCAGRETCVAGCTQCPDFTARWGKRTNTLCLGKHAVSGGCENAACRGMKLCLPDCMTCPDFVLQWGAHASNDSAFCTGRHKLSGGEDRCENPACKGRERCIVGCLFCPDFKSALATPNLICKGEHEVCANEACHGRPRCFADCAKCPDYTAEYGKDGQADSAHCFGNHSAFGEDGCLNAACRGRTFCRAGCTNCPDFRRVWQQLTNTVCTGDHAVAGGCEYQGCKGRRYCLPDCTTCPDFVRRFGVRAPVPPPPKEKDGAEDEQAPLVTQQQHHDSDDTTITTTAVALTPAASMDTVPHPAMLVPGRSSVLEPQRSFHTALGDVHRFTLLRDHVLGEGGFGVVYKAFDNLSGEYVAVKETKHTASVVTEDMRVEYECIKAFHHAHIVKVIDFILHEGTSRIVMEWMPSGSVQSILNNTRFRFHERVIRRYIAEALKGLAYLHDQGVLHRDIKPGNMLVDGAAVVKLSDFGTCQQYINAAAPPDKGNPSVCGTPQYMSPETVTMGWYSPGSDMWAIGCSIVQMATGQAPWSHLSPEAQESLPLMFKLATATPPDHHPRIPTHASRDLQNILERLFYYEPDKRPTAKELLVDPYFRDLTAPLPSDSESLAAFQSARVAAQASQDAAAANGGVQLTTDSSAAFLFVETSVIADVVPL